MTQDKSIAEAYCNYEKDIEAGIKSHLEPIVKRLVEKAKAELDAELSQIVAGIALHIMRQMDMKMYESKLVITVDLNNAKFTKQ